MSLAVHLYVHHRIISLTRITHSGALSCDCSGLNNTVLHQNLGSKDEIQACHVFTCVCPATQCIIQGDDTLPEFVDVPNSQFKLRST